MINLENRSRFYSIIFLYGAYHQINYKNNVESFYLDSKLN